MKALINRRTAYVVVALALGIALAMGCGGSKSSNPYSSNNNNPPPPPPPPVSTHTHNITIANFSFSPASLSIPAGDTVIWTNTDAVGHTVTSDTGSELGSSILATGATYMHVFTTAETASYHCSIHTYMHGAVIAQ